MFARRWKIAFVLSLVVTLLSACTGGTKSELEELPKDGTGKIRVAYYDEQAFMMEFGSTFNVKYPEIDIEVVPTSELFQGMGPNHDYEEKFLQFIKDKKVDIAMLSQSQYEKLAGDGMLYKLDSLIQDEKYPIDDFHPGVIDLLRQKGGNALYGLSTTLYANALFYNVDLFKEYGIDPPRHKMSAQEVLELAARFESKSKNDKDRIYGFHSEYNSPGQMITNLAMMSGLQVVDPKAEKIVMDSEGWRSLFIKYAGLVKDKKVNYTDPSDPANSRGGFGEGFAQGKSAMTIEGIWMISQIKYANSSFGSGEDKKKKEFEWNMVTAPVDPAKPDESSMVELGNIFSIMKDAPNKRAAWEFMKFTAGPEMARINGKSDSKLTTRTKYQKDISGKSTEAFTMLKPGANARSLYDTVKKNNVHGDFFMQLETKINEAIKTVVDGKKSPEQAYTDLLPELQQQLDAAKRKGAEEKAKEKK